VKKYNKKIFFFYLKKKDIRKKIKWKKIKILKRKRFKIIKKVLKKRKKEMQKKKN
jgi:hypothetical protein